MLSFRRLLRKLDRGGVHVDCLVGAVSGFPAGDVTQQQRPVQPPRDSGCVSRGRGPAAVRARRLPPGSEHGYPSGEAGWFLGSGVCDGT